MIRSIFAKACLAGSLAMLGACDSGLPDRAADPVREKESRELGRIGKFIEDNYVLDAHAMTISGMSAEQRALTLRFIDLDRRSQSLTRNYSAVFKKLRDMEPGFGEEDAPPVSRHGFLDEIATLNTKADILLTQVRELLTGHAASMDARQKEAFASCVYLGWQRELEPLLTADQIYRQYPARYLTLAFPGEEASRYKEYAAAVIMNYDLKTDFQRDRFGNVPAYAQKINDYERALDSFESAVADLKKDMEPVIGELKQNYAGYRHKKILMEVNYGYCSDAVHRFQTRQGIVSSISGPR